MAIASGGKLQSCLDEVWATIKLADDVKREIKASASKPGDKGDIALDATLRSLVLAATLAGAALTLPSNATLRLNPEASTPFLAFARAAIAIAAERLASALQLRPLTDDEERRAKFVLRGYQSSTLTGRAARVFFRLDDFEGGFVKGHQVWLRGRLGAPLFDRINPIQPLLPLLTGSLSRFCEA